jgi:WD40 repeat protein
MNTNKDGFPHRPYVGADVIQDQRLFFGRVTESEAVVDNLLAYRIVLLFSPSGAGKSSLIESGVKPRLIKDFNILPTIRLNRKPEPGQIPEETAYNRFILSALLSLQTSADVQVHTVLPGLIETTLTAYLQQHTNDGGQAGRTLLVFDQFEELLTTEQTAQAEVAAFLEDLMAVLYDYRYWALFAMREDYLAKLEPYLSYFPDRLSTHYYLTFLNKEAAKEAIIGPAEVCGVKFLPEAAEKLVNELSIKRIPTDQGVIEQSGDYVEPVQLQVVCNDLWDRPRPDQERITLDDVSTLANIDTALADHYNRKVGSVASALQIDERGIREWFDQQLISEQEFRKQTLAGTEAQYGMSSEAVMMLVNAYLVREDSRLGTTWYELAHDRLIRPVKEDNQRWRRENLSELQLRATDWQNNGKPESLLLSGKALDQATAWAEGHAKELNVIEKTFLETSLIFREAHLSMLQRKAKEWLKQGRPTNSLLSGSDLEEATAWATAYTDEISGLELEFLEKSRKRVELEERQRQRAKELRVWVVVLVIMFLVAGFFAINSYINATANGHLAGTNAAFGETQSTLAAQNAILATTSVAYGASQSTLAMDNADKAATIQSVAATSKSLQLTAEAQRHDNAIIALTSLAGKATSEAGEATAVYASRQALARQLASQSKYYFDQKLDLSTLLGIAAYQIDPTTWDSRSALLADLQANLSQDIRPYILAIPAQLRYTNNLDISPDGKIIAWSGADGRIILWDIAQKKIMKELRDPFRDSVTSQAFNPVDPNMLVTGSENNAILFWNLRDDTLDRRDTSAEDTVYRHQGKIRCLAFSSDGKYLATCGENRLIEIWDVAHRTQLTSFTTNAPFYWKLGWSPRNEYLAAAAADNKLYILDPQGGNIVDIEKNPGGDGAIYTIDWSPDGKRLAFGGRTGYQYARVYFYDIATQRFLPDPLQFEGSTVSNIAFDQSGALLAEAGWNDPVYVWDVKQGKEIARLTEYGDFQHALSLRKNLLAYLGNNTVSVYELAAPNPLSRELPPAQAGVLAVGVNPSGDLWVASQSGNMMLLQNRTTGQVINLQPEPNQPANNQIIGQLVFDRESPYLILADQEGRVQRRNPAEQVNLLASGLPTPVTSLAVSPDGSRLATSSCSASEGNESQGVCSAQIQLWDLAIQASLTQTISTTQGTITSLAFDPDGSNLASGNVDGSIYLWDWRTGQPIGLPIGDLNVSITSMTFSPDGYILAAGTEDGLLYLWDVQTGQALGKPFQAGNDRLAGLAYSPDGKTLYAGTSNGSLTSWDVDFSSWVERACMSVGRDFTPEELRLYFYNVPEQEKPASCTELLTATATPVP